MLVERKDKNNTRKRGFTIVELLIVIVIIAILASINIIVYSGMKRRAVHASVQSEASQLATQLALYNAENGDYPTEDEFNPEGGCDSETEFCFEGEYPVNYDCDFSGICEYIVQADQDGDGEGDCTTEDCGGMVGGIVGGGTISIGTIDLTQPSDCPTNFIPVPGNARYSQVGFCVMKYEAKNIAGKATSSPSGTPWIGKSQSDIKSTIAPAACDGCHLITESEWMTIAANVLDVNANYVARNTTVGNAATQIIEELYKGHDDGSPIGLLAASSNDSDGYYGTNDTAVSNQRRTLYLNNGKIIWDFSGNAAEFTSSVGGLPVSYMSNQELGCFDWNDTTNIHYPISVATNPSPLGTGIDGASAWGNSSNIGQVCSQTDGMYSNSYAYVRSRDLMYGNAGILSLSLGIVPTGYLYDGGDARSGLNIGFRLVR